MLAYVEGNDLYVACTGDSRAVLVRRVSDGAGAGGGTLATARWLTTQLSEDQTARNPDELRRMLTEHPGEEYTVISRGRVLGSLMPTRAFGDARYKWPKFIPSSSASATASLMGGGKTEFYNQVLSAFYSRGPARNYLTPPYVTALPIVTHAHIPSGNPVALVVATDGLWDELESEQVGEALGNAYTALWKTDGHVGTTDNAATHLIRESLGGKTDHAKVSRLLALPKGPVSRRKRDDVTVA
ncbi:hypothetical protein HDU93_005666, partial [Gonapodya sp. JEL0774]